MRLNVVLRYIGMIVMLNAAFMLVSAGVSLLYGMDTAFSPLLLAAILTMALGAFPLIFVGKSDKINKKESYAIVVGAWLMACLVGTFPYLLWGGEFNIFTAWFESVSGFTTTGATALNNVEALPHGLLFWRSSTHWMGGIGVVMFILIVLPTMGHTKMTLSSLEMSPLAKDNYRYRIQRLIQILLYVYIGLTAAETVLLRIAGMSWFDAINHSFSTVATGGFSTRNLSIAYYDNVAIESILMFFMAISGIHFGLIFATFTGKRNNIFRSEVTKYYIATFLVGGLIIAFNLWGTNFYDSFTESLRHSLFQSIAFITTTGFATTDANAWTPLAIILLIFMMIQCGCAGSTSGGMKSDRVWLALKVLRVRILRQQHPRAVIRIKLNNITQDEAVVGSAMLFIVAYLLIIFIGSVIMAAAGIDLMTSFNITVSSLGNVGPVFGNVGGTMGNYSTMSPFVKIFCSFLMLLGRLEIFGLIQLFLFKWWK